MNQNKTKHLIFVFQNLYFMFTQIKDKNHNLKIQNYKPQHISKGKDSDDPFIVTLKINLQTR